MSVAVLDDKHLNVLVSYAKANKIEWYNPIKSEWTNAESDEDYKKIIKSLSKVNNSAYNFRYKIQDDQPDILAVPKTEQVEIYSPVEIIKAANCFEYQCEGLKAWPVTEAFQFIKQIREYAIKKLAGYDSAKWHIS